MRGEDFFYAVDPLVQEGSPPHARGRPSGDKIMPLIRRITPACAGKTALTFSLVPKVGDHPRMRGEDVIFTDATTKADRITPACAGKTS